MKLADIEIICPSSTHAQKAPTRFTSLIAPPRVPSWCPRPPSLNVARKIERSRRLSAKTCDRAAGDERIKPAQPSRGVVWPRGAPYGLRARPGRPWPHPVARPGPGDRVDRANRLASAPAHAGGGRNRPSRRAVPTSFGWPCAHGLTAPPPRGTPRSEIIRSKRYALRPSGAARSPPRLCNFRASSTSAVDPARAQVRKKHHKTPHAPRAKCFQTKGGAFGQFVRKHAVPET